jgi:5-methylcytosine-specific restriction endonuclease McrA
MGSRKTPGICACGNKTESNGLVNGKRTYKRKCWSCRRYKHKSHPKASQCQRCGFVPEWHGQLDIDHIDGNHNNNSPDNLQTLCANCHRLKTHLSKDHMNPGEVGGGGDDAAAPSIGDLRE